MLLHVKMNCESGARIFVSFSMRWNNE